MLSMRKLDLAYHVLHSFGSCSRLLRHVKHDHMLLTCEVNEFPSSSANYGIRIADFGKSFFWHKQFHYWLMTIVLTAQCVICVTADGTCHCSINAAMAHGKSWYLHGLFRAFDHDA